MELELIYNEPWQEASAQGTLYSLFISTPTPILSLILKSEQKIKSEQICKFIVTWPWP